MKTILPWFLAIAALAGAYFLFSDGQKKSSELASLRGIVSKADAVRDENDSLKRRKAEADEIVRLTKDNEEIGKLRNEVVQLRQDKEGLSNQIQSAAAIIEIAKAKMVSIPNAPAQPSELPAPASREEMSSMKQFALAFLMFADEHGGSFPTNLVHAQPYFGTNFDSRLIEQFDFILPLQKLNEIQQPSSTVIAYGKRTDANGRRSYLFVDGHVEIRKDEK